MNIYLFNVLCVVLQTHGDEEKVILLYMDFDSYNHNSLPEIVSIFGHLKDLEEKILYSIFAS